MGPLEVAAMKDVERVLNTGSRSQLALVVTDRLLKLEGPAAVWSELSRQFVFNYS